MNIAFGCDHAGYKLRDGIINFVESLGHRVIDYGTHSAASCDYTEIAGAVSGAVSSGEVQRGILMCGTGIGMSIAANKFRGVRAAVCWNREVAKLCAEHNNANILCLSARFSKPEDIQDMIEAWIKTPFSPEARHRQRVEKIGKLEEKMCKGRK
ncbi:MAG TPA: ribose 5-phosphate isomerase B [Elusimicrobia bacterium]|nr:MAG: ribose 5-phosphate isomerase B [Elusimicrobia bacterium RIFOXYA12_FULL_49_49]OGS09485.1 MAG: ribose 5-phosphate isomerase B [Elusimicrobia bacterium RIFOXYA1_FULL_47_7]OGS10636.1 MAG: ribose 5-phosphate isomerase B [Elusimicrobia bacterium RIFOXYB1_FULL_48_9]OGS15855.1 MAG: ribose 5-phosphate isomerase B [Elusimicrobia bacterium RIFOXYA2_FULL_47_53]OGS27149.1 MAG: ribose 5-phosphate isomerase B [Elusimicrobia bacterium RIFOXYB12_FULL_50_12]OGS31187.1 MAG: ribose 5-phosphate isomerase B